MDTATINSGDTAWVLISAGLVLFMIPGLAFFYAGMVRTRNVLVMLLQNFIGLGLISITWILIGYALAFGQDAGGGLIGNLGAVGLVNLADAPSPALHVVVPTVAIPALAFVAYQMMFAVITPLLATGATADRLKFGGWVVFLIVWSIVIYSPIAHWLWNPDGWLTQLGAQDWAGGMVVHASAGAAALAIMAVVGRRPGWPKENSAPHSLPLVMIGFGILWFGWFGFNAADSLQADGIAAQALINTQVAAAAAMLAWLLMERWRTGHATMLGAATGAVAGLATVTPTAGYVGVLPAVIIGLTAGLVCQYAIKMKFRFGYDDALDVIAVHFLGGIIGVLMLGLFGDASINSIGANGLLYGGGFTLLGNQVIALVAVIGFSFAGSWILAKAIQMTIGFRVADGDEDHLDAVQQGAAAYALDRVAGAIQAVMPADEAPAAGHAGVVSDPGMTAERLVTAMVGSTSVGQLRSALLEAGAQGIALSEASVWNGETASQAVRGEQLLVNFLPRVRVEVLVPESSVNAVVQTLKEFAPEGKASFIQVIDMALHDGVPAPAS